MLIYPDIDPVAVDLGIVQVHWYGIMYIIGFVGGWWLGQVRAKAPNSQWTSEQVDDVLFYIALGVVLGGRVGYVLFYNFSAFLDDPLSLFYFQDGGMSFHGGFLGVMLAMYLFARKTQKHVFDILDYIAPFVTIGLGAGRIGNFINGELVGRVSNSDVPWLMIFPHVDQLPRHPSQLYQAITEGLLFFILLWWFSSKPRPRMAVSAVFLIGYGCFRFTTEFFREPDKHIGFVAFDWMTKGQELSLPMIVIGIAMLIWAYRRQKV